MKKFVSKWALFSAILGLLLGVVLVQGETGSAESKVAITNASFVAPGPERMHLNGEWVEIANQGSENESLADWTLMDQQNHTYTFKNLTLDAGSSVKVHTGAGNDSMTDVYWCRNSPVWNNDGDTAILRDASGAIVAEYPKELKGA